LSTKALLLLLLLFGLWVIADLFLSVDLNEWGDRGLCVVVRLQFHH
jgi:hypothetical protein